MGGGDTRGSVPSQRELLFKRESSVGTFWLLEGQAVISGTVYGLRAQHPPGSPNIERM